MRKGLFTIIVAVLLLAIAGIFAYYYLNPTAPNDNPDDPNNPTFPNFPDNPGGLPNATTSPNGDPGQINQRTPKLWQVSSDPVSGSTIIDQRNGPVFRFVERALGRIKEANPQTSERKIILSAIPQIYEAVWGSPDAVILRYLKEESVENFSVNIIKNSDLTAEKKATTTPDEAGIEGVFLPNKIVSVSGKPSEGMIFWLLNTNDGVSGFASKPDGSSRKQVWSSKAVQWNAEVTGKNLVTLTTRPSVFAPGFAYLLNTTTGGTSKIAGNLNGLTAKASPDGKQALISFADGRTLKTYRLEIGNLEQAEPLSAVTFPEKCVWSSVDKNKIFCAVPTSLPDAEYPDAWYRGEITTSDKLVGINLISGEINGLLWDQNTQGLEFDIISPQVSQNDEYILFTNKKDLTLWSFRLFDRPVATTTSTTTRR